jgi:hypothetical protein
MTKNKNHLAYQFRVSLTGIEPAIWRRIQVPAKYSFWDLHVAIQDVMGWLDYHLHAFRVRQKHKRKPIEIGIPGDEWDGVTVVPGWKVPITDYFTEPGQVIEYEYDFGDGWNHEILLEAVLLKERGAAYPRCVGGERACPPEDCGSISGYYNLLEILRDPTHPEYKENIAWLKGHAKNYYPYDPEKFNSEEVHFDNPKRRWRIAFSQDGEE